MNKERLEEIFDLELLYEDVPVVIKKKGKGFFASLRDETILVPIIVNGNYGIYAFVEDIEDASEIHKALCTRFKQKEYVFIFSEAEEGGSFYDDKTGNILDFEDFYGSLYTFRFNHMVPESMKHDIKFHSIEEYFEDKYELDLEDGDEEEDFYIRPWLNNRKVESIDETIIDMKEEPLIYGNYLYYPDGTVKVKRFVGNHEAVFDCDNDEPDKKYWRTVFTGWFGLHKFIDRKLGSGFLYLLTCGMCGVFYLLDLCSMAFGSYYRENVDYEMDQKRQIQKKATKVYMRPVENKKIAIIGLFIGIFITLLAGKFVYIPAYSGVSALMSSVTEKTIVNNENIINDIENSGILDDLQ